MSLPDEEARALHAAFEFLCDLSSGAEKRIPSTTRQRARDVLKHYPLAAGMRWFDFTASDVQAAIATIENSRQTHVEWRDYWLQNEANGHAPCGECLRLAKTAGDREHIN